MIESAHIAKGIKRRLSYVRLIRISSWLLIPLYIFIVLVPGYFSITAKLPTIDQLYVAEGRLVSRWMGGKKGYMTGVESNGGTQWFTCLGWAAGRHDCILNIQNMEGRRVTLYWFKHQIDPFKVVDRVAQITVEGEMQISYEDTEKTILRIKNAEKWTILANFVLFVVVAVFYKRLARRIENEQGSS